jgi:hypothetical protein
MGPEPAQEVGLATPRLAEEEDRSRLFLAAKGLQGLHAHTKGAIMDFEDIIDVRLPGVGDHGGSKRVVNPREFVH